ARGADLLSSLTRPVEQLVEREGQVRTVRHVELVLGPDAALTEGIELGEQRLRIEHDAVADQAHGALDDPRGNLVQYELAGGRMDRVASVSAALIAYHEIGALGEHVDDFPFALVAPLGADNHNTLGLRSEHGSPAKKRPARSAGHREPPRSGRGRPPAPAASARAARRAPRPHARQWARCDGRRRS